MTKETTLVILAAGIGSRYGGLKQLDTIAEHGQTIIDFSLYDAIAAGFSKTVFVVRRTILDDFRSAFFDKLRGEIAVEYVLQETDLIPEKFLPTEREKPWGTGHAVLMAKKAVIGNFCVINSDDFYGRSAFEKMISFLNEAEPEGNSYAMVGYGLGNTLSENGSVSRGQCFVGKENKLEKIIERTKIVGKNGKIVFAGDEGIESSIDPDTTVSMNFWGFTPKIFNHLEADFEEFLNANSDDPTAEFFLPGVIDRLIKHSEASVSVIRSESKWLGITYKEDKPLAASSIKKLQNSGIYPSKLW